MLLSRLYSPDVLHRIQIRYDTTPLGADGNQIGPVSGGAVIYPEYWESLIEDNMRIAIFFLPEETASATRVSSASGSQVISNLSTALSSTTILSSPSSPTPSDEKKPVTPCEYENSLSAFSDKENTGNGSTEKSRSYSSAVKQSPIMPLGVSTNVATVAHQSPSGLSPRRAIRLQQQVTVMPEDNSALQDKLYRPGRMSALTPDEAAQKAATEPFTLTYQACITLLAPLLPEKRHLTHPRLSPNIVTIRPCHENTLWIFCVIQRTLHPVTVRAFETIDIEELILRVLPPEVGIDKVVVLWRNMKFGGEGLPISKYNAKKETRGTGGRVMWKKNLAVLAAKNAEVFVILYESSVDHWGRTNLRQSQLTAANDEMVYRLADEEAVHAQSNTRSLSRTQSSGEKQADNQNQ